MKQRNEFFFPCYYTHFWCAVHSCRLTEFRIINTRTHQQEANTHRHAHANCCRFCLYFLQVNKFLIEWRFRQLLWCTPRIGYIRCVYYFFFVLYEYPFLNAYQYIQIYVYIDIQPFIRECLLLYSFGFRLCCFMHVVDFNI